MNHIIADDMVHILLKMVFVVLLMIVYIHKIHVEGKNIGASEYFE